MACLFVCFLVQGRYKKTHLFLGLSFRLQSALSDIKQIFSSPSVWFLRLSLDWSWVGRGLGRELGQGYYLFSPPKPQQLSYYSSTKKSGVIQIPAIWRNLQPQNDFGERFCCTGWRGDWDRALYVGNAFYYLNEWIKWFVGNKLLFKPSNLRQEKKRIFHFHLSDGQRPESLIIHCVGEGEGK